MSVEVFCTRKAGADTIVTRVGSSPPGIVGSVVPLTFGSSLQAKTVPLARRTVAWSVTMVPLAIAGLVGMPNGIAAPLLPATFRFRLWMNQLLLAPPLLLVALLSAPPGYVGRS